MSGVLKEKNGVYHAYFYDARQRSLYGELLVLRQNKVISARQNKKRMRL